MDRKHFAAKGKLLFVTVRGVQKLRIIGMLQSTPHDMRHGLAGYSMSLAIGGLQPRGERLGAFAGTAGAAAQRDIVCCDYFCVVNNMLPTCKAPFANPRFEGNMTVDATSVSLDTVSFEPIRDIPTVHCTTPNDLRLRTNI